MKKTLTLFLCSFLTFCVTACGNESDTKSEKKKDNKTNEVETINDNAVSNESIRIDATIEKFRDGLSVVSDEGKNRYVIDETGKLIYEITSKNSTVYISNGYIVDNNKILDKNGKEILSSKNKKYSGVSKSGYVAVLETTEDVSGTKEYRRFEDLKGNVIADIDAEYLPVYAFDDYFLYHKTDDDKEAYLYNVKTKEEIKIVDNFKDLDRYDCSFFTPIATFGDWYLVRYGSLSSYVFVKKDLSQFIDYQQSDDDYYIYDCYTLVFNKYLIGKGIQGGNSGEYKAFDLEGNIVKDFNEIGNIVSIAEYKNVIYVITNTGYAYTMNDKFEFITEPEKTDFNELTATENGVYAVDNKNGQNYVYLINDKFEIQKEIKVDKSYTDVNGDSRFIYNFHGQIFDTKINKELSINK